MKTHFPVLLAVFLLIESVSALETIRFTGRHSERNEQGRIILEAPDSFAFENRAGRLDVIEKDKVISQKSDAAAFTPYSKDEMLERLKNEFPPKEGYNYLDMYGPFIIVYTTSRAFANWYGGLLEKLHKQYVLFWERREVSLSEPLFPLVVLVFSSKEHLNQYAEAEGVTLLQEQCAYYHKLTNRIALFDMSGQQIRQEGNTRRATASDIRRFLTQPGALNNITTVIHEAVHQVGYNTGMHPRYAPVPVWVCEGLAIFHEVPDRQRSPGWTIGPYVNRYRLEHLRKYLEKPQQESPILMMIKDDELFQRSTTALDNYALAWGLTYFMVRRHPKDWAAYLAILQKKKTDSEDSPEIRIKEFESCFGNNWDRLHKEFFDYLRKL